MTHLPVIFRKESDGTIVAIFPTICEGYAGWHMLCYAHIGQHGTASLDYYQRDTKPALPDEYAPLLSELTAIYHDCQLVPHKRMTAKHREQFRLEAARIANL